MQCVRQATHWPLGKVSGFLFGVIFFFVLVLGPVRASAHLCGPEQIVMGVGDLRYYWITADVVEFQPSLYWIAFSGDQTIASIPTNVFAEYFVGFYPIQGLKAGTTSFEPAWAYPPNSKTGYCSLQVTVLTNPPLTSANYPMSGIVGDPNNAFTCEHTETEGPVLNLEGPMPLRLDLYYASGLSQNLLLQSSLGLNWSHNFDTRMVRVSNRVDIVTYQGLKLRFLFNGSTWQAINSQGRPFQLVSSGNNLVLGDRRQNLLYTFDPVGELIAIADGKGNVQSLTYSNNVLAQVSDGLGRVLNFSYTGFQLLSSVDDGTRITYFDVDPSNNRLADIVNPMGGTTTYSYDSTRPALLTAKTLPNGNTPVIQIYDSNGCVAQQVQAGTYTNAISYSKGLTVMTNSLGKTKTYQHNANGQLTSYTDEANHTVLIQSNTNGQRSTLTDRLGNTSSLGYDPVSHKVSAVTNADGSVILFSYSSRVTGGVTFYDLTQIAYPDSSTEQFTYDGQGNVLSRHNRAGQMWVYTYNEHGQILTERNPLGGVTTLSYNPDATLASSSDSDLGTTLYSYDAYRHLIKVAHPDGTSRQFVYDLLDRMLIATDERTNSYKFAYDSNGNVTNISDPNSAQMTFTYDNRDQLVRRTDRLGAIESFAYNALGELATVTNRNGDVCMFTYDSLGRPIGFVDANGSTWSLSADAENTVTGLTDPLGNASHHGLDAIGDITSTTNPLGVASFFMRNSTREVVGHTDELLRKDLFEYDLAGGLTNVTVPRLGSLAIQRNALGAPIRVTDFNGASWSFGSTQMGRPDSFGDPLAWLTRSSYSQRGFVSTTIFADGTTVSNSFDAVGNLLRAQYTDGTHLDYGYDSLNNVISANGVTLSRDAESRITNSSSWNLNTGASYTRLGLLGGVSYPFPSLTVSYQYDRLNRITNISDSLTGSYMRYFYDFGGRCTNIMRSNGVHGTCTYNAAGEPVRLQEGSYFSWDITRDAAGQPSKIIWNAPADPATSLTLGSIFHNYNVGSQISDPGFNWDWQGRLMTAPGRSNTYDGASRLKLSNGTFYQFDGFNNLIVSATGGNTNWYLYNHAFSGGAAVMGVYNVNAGAYTEAVINSPQGGPLWTIDLMHNNAVSFLHIDPNGSVAGMTDATGALTDKFSYSPFGSFTHSGSGSEYFTFKAGLGWKYDVGAKLNYSAGRFYDPSLAIHYTPDRLWPRLSDSKANPYGLDTSFRLNFAQYEYQPPPASDSLGSHFSVPTVSEFNVEDYLRNKNPEDVFRFEQPSSRTRPRLEAVLVLPLSRGSDCCCCCCCCSCCCCCCCCDSGPVARLDFSGYLRGGLYSPLTTSRVSRGLTQEEAFLKFFRASVVAPLGGGFGAGLNSLDSSRSDLGSSSWRPGRMSLEGLTLDRPIRAVRLLDRNVRAPSERYRNLLSAHLNDE